MASWIRALVAAAVAAVVAVLPTSALASADSYAYETRPHVYDAPAQLSMKRAASVAVLDSPTRPAVVSWGWSVAAGESVLAANTAHAGADDVLNGMRLRAQLSGEEISGGHAFQKHVIERAEFPGITTRPQFASHIEDVVLNGEMRALSGGRTGYWQNGTVVIRDPWAIDGGTVFRPTTGYDYFLNTLH